MIEKNLIFCFTGTGNSLKAAKDLGERLGNTTVLPMSVQSSDVDIMLYSRVGFIFPVYYQGVPARVEEFINGISIPREYEGYFFAGATYANFPGIALKLIDRVLQKHGCRLNYGYNLKMADNAVAYYKPRVDMEKLVPVYQKEMKEMHKEIISLKQKSIGKPFWGIEKYYRIQIAAAKVRDRNFTVSESCTGCGLCQRVCAVSNIKVENKSPVFGGSCQQCMACIQLCPVKAIDYKGKTKDRLRYRHPDVTIGDLLKFHKLLSPE